MSEDSVHETTVDMPDFVRRAIEAQGKVDPDEMLVRARGATEDEAPAPVQEEITFEDATEAEQLPLSDPVENRVGKHQRPGDASETQRIAALKIIPRTGTAREKVLRFIAMHPDGATDEEMQIGMSMNPSTQRPRRVELVEGGWIEDSGKRRETLASNTEAVVWALTERGIREYPFVRTA